MTLIKWTDKQKEGLALLSSDAQHVMLLGGSRCVSGDTILDGQDKDIKTLSEIGQPIDVITSFGIQKAEAPFKKGRCKMLTVVLEDGFSITVTPDHRFWNGKKWVYAKDLMLGSQIACSFQVFAYDKNRQASNSAFSLSEFLLSVPRLREKLLNYQGDCSANHHLYGQQLRQLVAAFLACYASQLYAQGHSHLGHSEYLHGLNIHDHHLSAPELICSRNGQTCNLHSMMDDFPLSYQHAGFLDTFFGQIYELFQGQLEKSPTNLLHFSLHKSFELTFRGFFDQFCQFFFHEDFSSDVPCSDGYTLRRVTLTTETAEQDFYTLHVPNTQQYYANGILNHNSGKTWLLCHTVFLRAMKYPNTRHAIIRQTQTAARRSLWMGTVQDVIASRYSKVALKINKTEMTVTFPNGSMVEILGVDEGAKEKMLGNEYTTIYFNECSEMMFSTVSFMYSRLAQKSAAKNKFFYDQNPPHVSHWSHPMFVQGLNYYTKEPHKNPADYVYLVMNPADNLQNISDNYIQQLMENMNDQQKQRFIFGQFTTDPDEKTVFTNWFIKSFETDTDAVFQFGCDFGFSVDPTVLIRCYLKERTLYIDHELYLKQCETVDLPKMFLSVPESQRYVIVADSSRPETISHMRRHGFPKMMPSLKGKNSVMEGIEFLKGYKIIVHPRCENIINELSFYSYATDKDSGKILPEIAKGQEDHGIDALRYSIEATKNLNLREVKPVSLFKSSSGW
jgi:phage terminase large subunit